MPEQYSPPQLSAGHGMMSDRVFDSLLNYLLGEDAKWFTVGELAFILRYAALGGPPATEDAIVELARLTRPVRERGNAVEES